MRAPVPALAALVCCSLAAAPRTPTLETAAADELAPTVARILRAALVEGETYPKLRELCSVAPHRLSGSPGAAAAVEWAKLAMERDGLENVRLEPCTVPRWERGDVELLRIVGPAARAGEELPILALGGSVATPPGGITAEVVVVRGFDELEARADEVAGRIVLFDRPMDPGELDPMRAYGGAVDQRVRGAVEAARRGAVAAIVRSLTTAFDDVPHTGGVRYADGVPRIPAAAVGTRGATRIAELVARGDGPLLHLELDCRTHPDAQSYNVVGELVGSELPDEIVIVSGHLDGWDVGEGAHDDGAGCCQAIEVARLLAALDLRARRTIRVVLWMNEENGLAGARAYRAAHADELADHVLAIESDSGGFVPRGFTTDAGPAARAFLERVAALLADAGAERVWTGSGGADVGVLAPDGVTTLGLRPDRQRYFDLHHSARDVFAEVSRRELELGTAALAVIAWAVADRPERLPRN